MVIRKRMCPIYRFLGGANRITEVNITPIEKVRKLHPDLKFSLCFNWAPCHEAYCGSGGIAPRILDLGTRWR
jgi:hypothetical protein